MLTKDHHATGPTTAAFSRVLLSSGEVGETASGTFTVAAPSADDSNDNTTSGCAALDSSDQATQTKGKAYASREYTAPSLALYAEEELAYLPGAAAPLMDALASAIKSCHTLTIDGATLAFTVVPTPTVAGSDQTFSALASGRISGRYVSIDMQMVRVGDTVLTLTYGGIDDPSAVEAVADRLLVHATAKAKGVL